MRAESSERKSPLRSGYTTGACATAASLGAAILLLERHSVEAVQITLPKGERVRFTLHYCRPGETTDEAVCAIIKDAGDDPDVTHQAEVIVTLKLLPEAGLLFRAGEGVGTVTKAGLKLAVGEPAINPVPRRMIRDHLSGLAQRVGYQGGFQVTIGIRNGEALARNTMNSRLGILGGLSILGTTGIVKPFSCSAYIASIQQGMDVAKANGYEHIAACTGSTSDTAIQRIYNLPETARIEMGDYVGAVIKHANKIHFARMSFIGGFGKISKLAVGHMNLHSQKSAIDFHHLASVAARLGASPSLRQRIEEANTSADVLALCEMQNIPLADDICALALQQLRDRITSDTQLECIAIDSTGRVAGRAGDIL